MAYESELLIAELQNKKIEELIDEDDFKQFKSSQYRKMGEAIYKKYF
ncbi:MAG TPA: hypothetical protein VLZ33_05825 [Dysgonamonadaceae bacterium]|nr:hypothetical protein [Dysgonamonadaceae bacterium]